MDEIVIRYVVNNPYRFEHWEIYSSKDLETIDSNIFLDEIVAERYKELLKLLPGGLLSINTYDAVLNPQSWSGIDNYMLAIHIPEYKEYRQKGFEKMKKMYLKIKERELGKP